MFLKDKLTLATERVYSDEGFLQVPARISRVGIQNYTAAEMGLTDREPNEIIRVYRPPSEVFSEKSLSSFANKPVTDNHPSELVTADNAKELSVGHAGPDVFRDGDFAKTMLHITDSTAINKIESGKVELSNGYIADIDWTPGVTPSGEQYDAVQRNIKGNHIAIVEKGRAGSACKLSDNLPNEDKIKMPKITIDGVDYEVIEQVGQAVNKLQTRLADAEKETKEKDEELKKKDEEMEEKEKENAKSKEKDKAKIDDAKSKVPSSKVLDELVSARITLIDSILKVSPDLNWEGKDSAALKKEVVGEHCSNVQLDSVSDDYIDARFDMLLDAVIDNPQQLLDESLSSSVTTVINDSKTNKSKAAIARDKFADASRNAWKKGETK